MTGPPPPRSLTAPSAVLHGPTSPHILLVFAGKGSKRTQTESFSPPVFLGDICLDPVRIDNLRLFIVFPIQALTAAVTKALVLPIQGNSTPWTDGVASVMPKHAYLGHGRRLTKGQFQKKLLFLSQPSSPHSWISSRNNSARSVELEISNSSENSAIDFPLCRLIARIISAIFCWIPMLMTSFDKIIQKSIEGMNTCLLEIHTILSLYHRHSLYNSTQMSRFPHKSYRKRPPHPLRPYRPHLPLCAYTASFGQQKRDMPKHIPLPPSARRRAQLLQRHPQQQQRPGCGQGGQFLPLPVQNQGKLLPLHHLASHGDHLSLERRPQGIPLPT